MKHFFWPLLLLLLPLTGAAQSLDSLLLAIEHNNKSLQALKKGNEATMQEVQAQNRLEDPTVEYSPFFQRNVKGMASSELVVSQGFDFPTLYAARNRYTRLQETVTDWQYESARRDVLLAAKQFCLDLIYLNREKALLAERQKNADELQALYEKRLAQGDATLIDLNKIKMDHMAIRTEMAQNDMARATALEGLQALNGGEPVAFSGQDYPASAAEADLNAMRDYLLRNDAALQAAEAAVSASRQEVKVNRQGWIPKLELGYRRNTDQSEASHGLLIGATIPLFSTRDKVKVARQRLAEAQLQQEEARVQAESALRTKFGELQQLKRAAAAYDVELMRSSLQTLKKSIANGELSVIEYYTEADNVYRNLQERLKLESQYQKALADLLKSEL